MRLGYYDRHGQPITFDRYLELLRDDEPDRAYSRIALDDVGDVRVSTVWLGLDHGWGTERPVIFETMVFGGPLDEEVVRYSTESEARAGHAAMVQRVKAAAA